MRRFCWVILILFISGCDSLLWSRDESESSARVTIINETPYILEIRYKADEISLSEFDQVTASIDTVFYLKNGFTHRYDLLNYNQTGVYTRDRFEIDNVFNQIEILELSHVIDEKGDIIPVGLDLMNSDLPWEYYSNDPISFQSYIFHSYELWIDKATLNLE